MIEVLTDMPSGTLGFKASGKLSHGDYVDVAIPPLRHAVEAGRGIRLLYQIGPGFSGLETSALWDELKADVGLGLRHLSAWERTAVVSDEKWLTHMAGLFGWLFPGEIRMFALADLDAARPGWRPEAVLSNDELVRQLISAWERRDPEFILGGLADVVVYHSIPLTPIVGRPRRWPGSKASRRSGLWCATR